MLVNFIIFALIFLYISALGSACLSKLILPGQRDLYIYIPVIGILILAAILLLLSLYFPLKSYLVLFFLIFTVTFIFHKCKSSKVLFLSCLNFFDSHRLPLFIIFTSVAFYSSQVVYWTDSYSYHYPIVRWLYEFGLVKGVVNLAPNLGNASSWFALTAILNHENLSGRTGTCINGLFLSIVFFHLYLSIKNVIKNSRDKLYLFITFNYVLIILFVLRWGVTISPSPDLPIMFLPLFFVSLLIRDNQDEKLYFIALLIGSLSLNIKFSILPLLLIIPIIRFNLFFKRKFYVSLLLIIFCIFPVIIGNLIQSGYPLYPLSLFDLNLDWKYPQIAVNRWAEIIHDFSIYPGYINDKVNLNLSFAQIFYSWASMRENLIILIFLLLNFFLVFFLLFLPRTNKIYNIYTLILVSISGILFFLYFAPSLRFGIGWLFLLPSFYLAFILDISNLFYYIKNFEKFFLFSIPFIFAFIIWLSPSNFQKILYEDIDQGNLNFNDKSRLNFILPPKLPFINIHVDHKKNSIDSVSNSEFYKIKIGNIVFFKSQYFCFYDLFPCIPNDNLSGTFKLRDYNRGLASGFEHSAEVTIP